MASSSQRLAKRGVKMVEFAQNTANLTAASQNLYELVQAQNLIVYPSSELRTAVSRATAVETPRGWRIGKTLASHRIDVVVALAMAAWAAVQAQGAPVFNWDAMSDTGAPPPEPKPRWHPQHERYARPPALYPREEASA
jgi:phage terminase large subunit-like protein